MAWDREPDYHTDLARVATVPEVAELWGVSRQAVVNWIMYGHVVGVQRRPRSSWLVALRSVIAYIGPPAHLVTSVNDSTLRDRLG